MKVVVKWKDYQKAIKKKLICTKWFKKWRIIKPQKIQDNFLLSKKKKETVDLYLSRKLLIKKSKQSQSLRFRCLLKNIPFALIQKLMKSKIGSLVSWRKDIWRIRFWIIVRVHWEFIR